MNSPHKHILYYSVNEERSFSMPYPPIGLGIFGGQVGEDVIEYITACLVMIPYRVHQALQGRNE